MVIPAANENTWIKRNRFAVPDKGDGYIMCCLRAWFVALVTLASNATADERAPLLDLLQRKNPATIEELKPYYLRDMVTPRRLQEKLTNTEKITDLGRRLFFDPRLSASKQMGCVTCHNPDRGWTDGLARSVEANRRRSMSLYNLAWDNRFTWNGQAGSLMSQAILALTASGGMSAHFEVLPEELGKVVEYKRLFAEAFSGSVPEEHLIGPDTIAVALEYFVSTIVSGAAPFDKWIEGDESAISSAAKRGFVVFNGKGECAFCHGSWRFSDGNIYDTGLSDEPANDKAHGPTAQTRYAFKAVGLRNIDKRPPYMHDGSLRTLLDVIDFYNRGGNVTRDSKSKHIHKLNLTWEEKRDLEEFMRTFSE